MPALQGADRRTLSAGRIARLTGFSGRDRGRVVRCLPGVGVDGTVCVRMRVHSHSVHRSGPPSHPQRGAPAHVDRHRNAAGRQKGRLAWRHPIRTFHAARRVARHLRWSSTGHLVSAMHRACVTRPHSRPIYIGRDHESNNGAVDWCSAKPTSPTCPCRICGPLCRSSPKA